MTDGPITKMYPNFLIKLLMFKENWLQRSLIRTDNFTYAAA